jgi:hypothetical protein
MPLWRNKEWVHCHVKVELVSRAAYNPNTATRQCDIERLVEKTAKEARASTKLREIRDSVETNYDDSDEFALGESSSFSAVLRIGAARFGNAR